MKFIIKHQLTIIGVLLGAIGGFLYYYFIGCESGSCAITSKPLNSVAYFSVLGGLFFNIFKKQKNEN
jgi:hypothetical protein